MLIKVPELLYDRQGGVAKYGTRDMYVNTKHISLIREDTLLGKECISIVLEHNQFCLDMTMDQLLRLIPIDG